MVYNPDSLIERLDRLLSNVDHWLSIYQMTINTKITEGIFFGNNPHLKKLHNGQVVDNPLERNVEKMQWKYQIRNDNLKLGKIEAIASFLTPHEKNCWLMHAVFHSCSPAWSNAAPLRLNKIIKKVADASFS